MRTVLLFTFVAALFIACGNRAVKNPEAPTLQSTDTDKVKIATDTVSAQTDTSGLQEEKPQGIQKVVCRLKMIPEEKADSAENQGECMDDEENSVYNDINSELTDSINE